MISCRHDRQFGLDAFSVRDIEAQPATRHRVFCSRIRSHVPSLTLLLEAPPVSRKATIRFGKPFLPQPVAALYC